jgi:dolichol-phosphate mannosyltransferase
MNALQKITNNFEVIFVDDGSEDNSLSILMRFNKTDGRCKVLQLSRNYGHQAAYTAGLSVAQGEYIVLMDGDLQDPPELIEEMYKKLIENEKVDVIFAKRISKKETLNRRFFMSIFHGVFSKIIKSDSVDSVGNFSAFRKSVKEAILSYPEKLRYLPGIRAHVGFVQEFVYYDRDERYAGKAKMSFVKLVNLALDALFSFSNLPIRIMLFLGLIGVSISFVGIIYVLISKFIGIAPFGWSSTLFMIFIFGSLQITFLGLIGEYIYRIYKEVQNRPLYIVKSFF